MLLNFTKMHGLGNDFVVIDGVTRNIQLSTEQIQFIANRNFGIGCDQILLVEPPTQPGMDFRYRIFNADGSEVEHCGNGARCFARFVYANKLSHKKVIRVETSNANIELSIEANDSVRVDMGVPCFIPAEIPFIAPNPQQAYPIAVELDGSARELSIGVVSVGNPHGVLCVPDVEQADLDKLGAALSKHPRFPNQANIGFMEIISPAHIKLRVFERGAGETLACGTGACAAVIIGIERGLLESPVMVTLPGGDLSIRYNKRENNCPQSVIMTGPATFVFEGTIQL